MPAFEVKKHVFNVPEVIRSRINTQTRLSRSHFLVCSEPRSATEWRCDGTPLRYVPDYEHKL